MNAGRSTGASGRLSKSMIDRISFDSSLSPTVGPNRSNRSAVAKLRSPASSRLHDQITSAAGESELALGAMPLVMQSRRAPARVTLMARPPIPM